MTINLYSIMYSTNWLCSKTRHNALNTGNCKQLISGPGSVVNHSPSIIHNGFIVPLSTLHKDFKFFLEIIQTPTKNIYTPSHHFFFYTKLMDGSLSYIPQHKHNNQYSSLIYHGKPLTTLFTNLSYTQRL